MWSFFGDSQVATEERETHILYEVIDKKNEELDQALANLDTSRKANAALETWITRLLKDAEARDVEARDMRMETARLEGELQSHMDDSYEGRRKLLYVKDLLRKALEKIKNLEDRDNKKVKETILKKDLSQKLPPELLGQILQQGVMQNRKKGNSVKKNSRSRSKRRASRRR